MSGIEILGTGRYVPPFVVTNDDMAKIVDTSDEWIRTRSGIERRHISLEEPGWYMGARAAEQAMERAGITAAEVDMLVVTTVTADCPFPSTACLIQEELGAKNAFCFDIGVACAGITYSLDMARRYLACGDVQTVLVVAAERLSQVTNYEDRATCVLLGDGAGALVVRRSEKLFASYLRTHSEGIPHLYAVKTRRELPFGDKHQDLHWGFEPAWRDLLFMNGKEVYKFATQAMPRAINAVCEKAGVQISDLDLIIPHQANLRIIETAAKHLELPMERIYVNIQEYGNTSSATIPIGIDECVESGRLRRGDKVCIVGFGAGLTLGANIFEY